MSKIGRNLTFLLISQFATWSITLVVLIIIPDRLGEADFGKFGFAVAFVQYFTLAASLGTATLLAKLVARDRTIFARYVYNALVLKVALVAALSTLAVFVAWAIGTRGDTLVLVALGCVGMMFTVLNEVFVGGQAGLEVMGRPAMWMVVQTYVASILGLVLVLQGAGVVAYGAAVVLATAVPVIANARKVWPWLAGGRSVDLGIWRTLVTHGAPLMVLNALNLFYGTIDIPILSRVAGDDQVGWYTLAYRYVAIPIFIATAAVNAFFPSFSAFGATSQRDFATQVNRALRLVVVVSVPAAAGIATIAHDMIRLLYSGRYTDAVAPIQILALHIPLACIGVVLGTALIASDRHHRYLWVAGLAAVIAPFVGYVAVRWGLDRYDNGAIGASVSTLLIELVVMSGAVVLRAPGVFDRSVTWFALRVVAAAAVMAAAVSLIDLPLFGRIVIGMALYLAMLVVLGVFGIGDVRSAFGRARSMLRRPGPGDAATDSDAAVGAATAASTGDVLEIDDNGDLIEHAPGDSPERER
ncbi:MAG: flippase [Desertimonas sp.]